MRQSPQCFPPQRLHGSRSVAKMAEAPACLQHARGFLTTIRYWERTMADHDSITRTCTACAAPKPFSEFNKKKGGKHGLQPVCRPCQKAAHKAWRDANPDKVKSNNSTWYADKVWRENNPELARLRDLEIASVDRSAKACRRCGERKPISDFNVDNGSADGFQYKCRACQKDVRRDWYLLNREDEIQKSIAWARNNPEKAREKDRRRAILRPGRTTPHIRNWRARNPEHSNALSRAWKKANPEKVRASARALYAKNPDRNLAQRHARRAKSPHTGKVFTRKDVVRIFALQKGKCACCATALGRRFHRDHIMPLALGGTNDPLNIQILCPPCNHRKHAKHPIDFMQENGFLL